MKSGRRILRISADFLPVLMGKGKHHYSVQQDIIPDDCRIINATIDFRGPTQLVLLVESQEWEEAQDGSPFPEITPLFVNDYSLE
jgi:hypothetical protein